eukprot:TRINITY_DN2283_c1_g2_i1.p1 TRINITY_DN2283_c1_g2~~TRINITY_DN2283_c1_g2_i1.p1  ORF type:complete len:309 (+),score=48.33 TRINITY_DN2283_c1_g2_i1:40-927(+)
MKPEQSDVLNAIQELTELIKTSQATTYQELEDAIKVAVKKHEDEEGSINSFSITSGCDIFRQFISRMNASQLAMDFNSLKDFLCTRAEEFHKSCQGARSIISKNIRPFLRDTTTILVHGYSRTVIQCLLEAAADRRLNIFVTECRPACEGYKVINSLKESYPTVKLVADTAVAALLSEVDLVLFGAGVVTENGGIINTVGTYQTALLASMLRKPVYVCADKLKFAKIYPLDQSELPPARNAEFIPVENTETSISSGFSLTRSVDYTPPQYITQIHTDLGIMTPSAISDELIKLVE